MLTQKVTGPGVGVDLPVILDILCNMYFSDLLLINFHVFFGVQPFLSKKIQTSKENPWLLKAAILAWLVEILVHVEHDNVTYLFF